MDSFGANWLRCICISLVAIGIAAAGVCRAADEVEIHTTVLAPGIAMLVGQGGNLGVSYGPNGTLVIDDQFAPLSNKILAAVAKLASTPLRYVVNTHWHGDHTGGNSNMASAGAVIVAHDNVRVRMSQDQFSAALGRKTPASPAQALPMITFARDVTFHFNGQVIHAVHVDPAHTDGDSVIFFEGANVVHMGDTYFNGFYPFVDFSTGGEPRGMVAAVDMVLARTDDETQIIPGHGPLSNRRELVAYREMLDTICDRIAAAIAEGKSVDEVVAIKPTADFDAKWGNGFLAPDQFVGILYRGLVD